MTPKELLASTSLAAFLAAPFVMLLVRLSRGHFHKDIREKRTKI